MKTVFGIITALNQILILHRRQRKAFCLRILRIWKRRGMGIAVILGHLMHSNGGPFTTSFYLNGPKSRGRKQLNNKLQIRFFHSATSFSLAQHFFFFTIWTNLCWWWCPVFIKLVMFSFYDDDDATGEKEDGQWMFMGNVRVVDNWKAIFTPIPLFFFFMMRMMRMMLILIIMTTMIITTMMPMTIRKTYSHTSIPIT